MRLHFYRYCFWAALVALVGCTSSDDDAAPAASSAYRRTVVVYMAAQNTLGYAENNDVSCAQSDSAEIAFGASMLPTERDNVLLFIDDDKAPRLYRYFKYGQRGLYQKVYQYPTDVDSADPSTLRDVLERVVRLYPSESYGLVLWSHGSGWLPATQAARAFSIDVGTGGNMRDDTAEEGQDIHEMDIAPMADAIVASGMHPDFILFDACAMQCVEVAYALRHATDYVVASPTTTPAVGLTYYEQMANGFFLMPTNDVSIRQIVDTHRHCVFDCDSVSKLYDKDDFTWSIVKTSGLDALANATSAVYDKAMSHPQAQRLNEIMDSYVSYELMGYPDFFDVSTAFYNLLPTADYADWRATLDRAVIYFRASQYHYIGVVNRKPVYGITDLKHGCGLSMYFPQTKYSVASSYRYNQAYAATAWGQAMSGIE